MNDSRDHAPEADDLPELTDARELRCVRITDAFHVQELAEALHAAGIPSRIDTHPPGAALASIATRGSRGSAVQIGLYVRPADLEAAHAALTEHDRARMPDSEGWDDVGDADPNACPGCGAALAPSAESCAECGLEFPAAATCAQCGSLADAARSHCAVCGAELAG